MDLCVRTRVHTHTHTHTHTQHTRTRRHQTHAHAETQCADNNYSITNLQFSPLLLNIFQLSSHQAMYDSLNNSK